MMHALTALAAMGSLDRAPPDPNPFRGVDFLRAVKYTEGVGGSIQKAGGLGDELGQLAARAARIPTAIWLDKISELPRAQEALEMATEQQSRTGTPVLVVFVVYNMPGRDCGARASNGEISASAGLPAYENTYLQPLLAIVRQYPKPRIVFLIEPDSLPNLVTNMWSPKCAAVRQTYIDGVARAAEVLGPVGTVYLDVGWSGWIGSWSAHKMAAVLDSVLNRMPEAAVAQVRGIVTDISNYGTTFKEVDYAKTMLHEMELLGRSGWHALIDTGRNAVDMGGQIWCNANGAGAGKTATAETGDALIDACAETGLELIVLRAPTTTHSARVAVGRYFWIKPPGESDGISDPTSSRYDSECGKPSAMRNAPNAGEWFHDQFVMLMQNAKPPLDQAPSYEPRVAPPQAAEAMSPPSAARPEQAVTHEGDFTFSYDDAAEIADEEKRKAKKTGATKPTGPKFVWRAPPPPSPPAAPSPSAPAPVQLPPLSGAQVIKLAAIAVAAATLVALLWNALCPAAARRVETTSPSRSRRRLRSERLRRVSEDGVEDSF